MITEAHGVPLAVSLTGGNRNDITQLMPLIAAIPPVRGRRGRPRQRPDQVYADRGYDHDKYRRQVREKGITPVIARRGTEHGSGLGVHRWVVEQSIALLHWFRRLRIRWEIRDDIHEAFLSLACAIICWRRLATSHFVRTSKTRVSGRRGSVENAWATRSFADLPAGSPSFAGRWWSNKATAAAWTASRRWPLSHRSTAAFQIHGCRLAAASFGPTGPRIRSVSSTVLSRPASRRAAFMVW